MACPALPLCGLAVTEAERAMGDFNARIRASLTKVGMGSETMVVRMTGCPNGCARPYMAELGLVGDGPNSYQLYLGGNSNQTRLADLYADRVKVKVSRHARARARNARIRIGMQCMAAWAGCSMQGKQAAGGCKHIECACHPDPDA